MEPQLLGRGRHGLTQISQLRQRYSKEASFISLFTSRYLNDKRTPSLQECWQVMQSYYEASRIADALKGGRSQNYADLGRLETKIDAVRKRAFVTCKEQDDLADVYLGDCIDINQKLSALGIGEAVVNPTFFTWDDNVFGAVEIDLTHICVKAVNDFLKLSHSLIIPPEVFRIDLEGNAVFTSMANDETPDIRRLSVIFSEDGVHCRVDILPHLIISNSDCLAPTYMQTMCQVDNESIDYILKERDPASRTREIPVLRGHSDMSIKVAKHFGLI